MFKKLLLLFSIGFGISSLFFACSSLSNKDLTKASVVIRNIGKTSGGSGVILNSSKFHSTILTNGHVCDVIAQGGIVTTDDSRDHLISKFIKSEVHDLCMIHVEEDLNASSKVSMTPPSPYEEATVIGHPHLNPTTITQGYFGQKTIIRVVTGTRECTDAEKTGPSTYLGCALFGSAPIIKDFQAIYVSTTIQAGSSGSPIYNNKREISGLIFAGDGDFSYGFAVPLEYIINFLYVELPELE